MNSEHEPSLPLQELSDEELFKLCREAIEKLLGKWVIKEELTQPKGEVDE